MTHASEVLVDHALSLDWSRLPLPTRSAAKTFLHDTLCVGVAGARASGAARILTAARAWCGAPHRGSAILGGSGLHSTAPYAAFVNAWQIHCQEFDAVHEPAVAHPMATVLAALLADAERIGPCRGDDFLAALVAGVDVVATLGVAATSPLKFFRPATAGVFGSVAALCRLRRVDRQTALDAFGYALAFASGTMQAHVEGKPTLAVQVAAAARSAVEALDLALAGMPGPIGSIDGPYGYLALFEDRHALDAPLARLGRTYRIDEVSWKPFPTGRAAHGAIVATQSLMREHGLRATDVERLVYRAPSLIARLVGRAARPDMDVAHARLCFPYLGAVVLTRGTVGLDDFSPALFADPALQALAARIVVEVDDNPDPAAFVPATATLTAGGRTFERTVDRQFGSPAWPLSVDEHRAKAEACLAFGGLPDAHAPLIAAIEAFDASDDALASIAMVFGRSS